jgi:hypothetical protein
MSAKRSLAFSVTPITVNGCATDAPDARAQSADVPPHLLDKFRLSFLRRVVGDFLKGGDGALHGAPHAIIAYLLNAVGMNASEVQTCDFGGTLLSRLRLHGERSGAEAFQTGTRQNRKGDGDGRRNDSSAFYILRQKLCHMLFSAVKIKGCSFLPLQSEKKTKSPPPAKIFSVPENFRAGRVVSYRTAR